MIKRQDSPINCIGIFDKDSRDPAKNGGTMTRDKKGSKTDERLAKSAANHNFRHFSAL